MLETHCLLKDNNNLLVLWPMWNICMFLMNKLGKYEIRKDENHWTSARLEMKLLRLSSINLCGLMPFSTIYGVMRTRRYFEDVQARITACGTSFCSIWKCSTGCIVHVKSNLAFLDYSLECSKSNLICLQTLARLCNMSILLMPMFVCTAAKTDQSVWPVQTDSCFHPAGLSSSQSWMELEMADLGVWKIKIPLVSFKGERVVEPCPLKNRDYSYTACWH